MRPARIKIHTSYNAAKPNDLLGSLAPVLSRARCDLKKVWVSLAAFKLPSADCIFELFGFRVFAHHLQKDRRQPTLLGSEARIEFFQRSRLSAIRASTRSRFFCCAGLSLVSSPQSSLRPKEFHRELWRTDQNNKSARSCGKRAYCFAWSSEAPRAFRFGSSLQRCESSILYRR